MFQDIRKKFLTPPELKLIELTEGAVKITRSVTRSVNIFDESIRHYTITLKCAEMTASSVNNSVTMYCSGKRTESKISNTFLYCIDYLWKKDHEHRCAMQKVLDDSELMTNVEKFAECATKCPEKK